MTKPLPDIHDRDGWMRWFKEQGYDYIDATPPSELDRQWGASLAAGRKADADRKSVADNDDPYRGLADEARALIATRRRNFLG